MFLDQEVAPYHTGESIVERYKWPFPLEDKRSYTGAYVGKNNFLSGQRAIIHKVGSGKVAAQFDDIQTGLGFYWWKFQESEFDIDPPVDWGDDV